MHLLKINIVESERTKMGKNESCKKKKNIYCCVPGGSGEKTTRWGKLCRFPPDSPELKAVAHVPAKRNGSLGIKSRLN